MPYRNTSPTYRIPYIAPGELSSGPSEKRAALIVDSQLQGVARLIGDNGIIQEGAYTSHFTLGGNSRVDLAIDVSKPAIEAVINGVYVRQNETLSWTGLPDSGIIYLYVRTDERNLYTSTEFSSLAKKEASTTWNTTRNPPPNSILVGIARTNFSGLILDISKSISDNKFTEKPTVVPYATVQREVTTLVENFSGLDLNHFRGYSGFSGQVGRSGYSGKSGYSGQSGYSGFSGGSGAVGPPGDSGTSGYSGYSGFSGSGTSGYSGFSGAGLSGYSGFSGQDAQTSGYSGFSGLSGYSGYSGSGISGYSGFSGSGLSGFSGFSGVSGYSGYSGAVGATGAGTSGYSGFSGASAQTIGSGYSGYSGQSGFSGFSGVGLASRQRVDITTGLLSGFTNNNFLSGLATGNASLAMMKTAAVISVQSSAPAWIRMYGSVAERSADVSRPIDADPTPGTGVMFDGITTNSGLTIFTTPVAIVTSHETPPSANMPVSIINQGSILQPISITVQYLQLEN